jgi:hypothetical protein
MTVAWLAVSEPGATEHIERRKERRGAVALALVGDPFAVTPGGCIGCVRSSPWHWCKYSPATSRCF